MPKSIRIRMASEMLSNEELWKKEVLLTQADFTMGHGLVGIPVKAFFTVMAVASRRVVPAVHANSTALPSRQLVQLHAELTASTVHVAVAGCEESNKKTVGKSLDQICVTSYQ